MASNGPVEAAPDVEVTSISNGNSHSAAILSERQARYLCCSLLNDPLACLHGRKEAEVLPCAGNGMVLTWGRGEDGQLGAPIAPPPSPAHAAMCPRPPGAVNSVGAAAPKLR